MQVSSITTTTTVEQTVSDMFVGLNSPEISTGILYDRSASLADLPRYDGVSYPATPIPVDQWTQMIHEVYMAAYNRTNFKSVEQVRQMAQVHFDNGYSPIAILRYRFEYVDPNAFYNGLLTYSDATRQVSRTGNPATSPYRQGSGFAAAVLSSRVFSGKATNFLLPSDLHMTNYGVNPSSIRIDFGDGVGFRTLGLGSSVSVTYGTTGEKTISVEATYGTTVLQTRAVVTVEQDVQPSFQSGFVTAGYYNAGQGSYPVRYKYAYYYGNGNQSLKNPIIIVDGIDPGNTRDFPRIYEMLDKKIVTASGGQLTGMASELRARGYDIVLLDYENGTDYIQANALSLRDLIGRVNQAIGDAKPLTVVGPSIGGLVSRYALASMERDNIDHNVRLYISYDAPHEGAVIPPAFQATALFADGLVSKGLLPQTVPRGAVASVVDALNSPAARQMLLYHVPSAGPAPLRNAFLTDLANAGNYPRWSRNVAVAKGSAYGKNQCDFSYNDASGTCPSDGVRRAPGSRILSANAGGDLGVLALEMDVELWNTPASGTGTVFQGEFVKAYFGRVFHVIPYWHRVSVSVTTGVSGARPLDTAPGSYNAFGKEMRDAYQGLRHEIGILGALAVYAVSDLTVDTPYSTFITTTSALGLNTTNANYNVTTDPSDYITVDATATMSTPNFQSIFVAPDNQGHTSVSEAIRNYVLAEVDRLYGRITYTASQTFTTPQTYPIGKEVIVADNVVLTYNSDVKIERGVTFLMGQNSQIVVRGRMTAAGEANKPPIRFKRLGASAWKEVTLIGDGNTFDYVVFEGGTKTIEIASKNNIFRHVRFKTGWRGVSSGYATTGGRSSFTLEHCVVEDNSSVGVVAYHANANIRYSRIERNGEAGLWFTDSEALFFHHNVIAGNAVTQTTRAGLEVNSSSLVAFMGEVDTYGYNHVVTNKHHELQVVSGGQLFLGDDYTWQGGKNCVGDAYDKGVAGKYIYNTAGGTVMAEKTFWGTPGDPTPTISLFQGGVDFDLYLTTWPNCGFGAAIGVPARIAPSEEAAELASGATISTSTQPSRPVAISSVSADPARRERVKQRMADLRAAFAQQLPDPSSARRLLRELFMLQRLDRGNVLKEQDQNMALLARLHDLLQESRRRGNAGKALQAAGEAAILLQIQDALLAERYDAAKALIESGQSLIESVENHRLLLLHQVSILERAGRFAEALTTFERFKAMAPEEQARGVEHYAIIEESLKEALATGMPGGISIAHAPSTSEAKVETEAATPARTALDSSYPNPFNPVTTIPFSLAERGAVRLEVYDLLGRRVQVLAEGTFEAGAHVARFEGYQLPSGMYLLRLQIVSDTGRIDSFTQVVTLLK